MITLREIGWVAGFLEGEGYFGRHYRPEISAAQVNREALDHLQRLVGGTITGPYSHKNPNHRPYWLWRLSTSAAAGLMMTLYSLLSQKRRDRIAESLQQWRRHPAYIGFKTHCQCSRALDGERGAARKHRYCIRCDRIRAKLYQRRLRHPDRLAPLY